MVIQPNAAGVPSAPAWDPVVRLTHWGVASAVILNGFVVEDESLAHVWIGYAALAFVVLRLIWGVISTDEARFTSFPPSLRAAREHIAHLFARRHRTYRSHNPLGTLMVYALWAMLILVTTTGVMMESDPFPSSYPGGFLGVFEELERDHAGGKILEEIHEVAANMLLFLAVIHVGGVLMESWLSGVNLVRAMVRGGKGTQGRE